ncbi:hypothetical protein [Pontibacter sp. G13]|uniref:hypothetical protein n=1 Tax=Pontibacter sp. G13 TaxID=3074898 RepID=UPI00288A4B8D|nr:hypothetical protein [Pontibacter sp. G13]WNJ21053.1 hypothetical protein RJD25_11335 [Pontibacter sp. G13]
MHRFPIVFRCFLALFVTLILSCGDSNPPSPFVPQPDTESLQEFVEYQAIAHDIWWLAEVAMTESGVYKTQSICADVEHFEVSRVLLVDFGTQGCIGVDGRTRRGQITIRYIGTPRTPGFSYNIQFNVPNNPFFVDDRKVLGSIQVGDFVRDGDQILSFSISDSLTFPRNGLMATVFHSQRTLKWISGENNGTTSNDVFEVSGSFGGMLTTLQEVEAEIQTPLLLRSDCMNGPAGMYPLDGVISQQIGEWEGGTFMAEETYQLDFGIGACDLEAKIRWNDQEADVNLVE